MTGTLPHPDRTVATPRRPRVTRALLVGVLGLHAALAALQPFLAGAYLSGSVDAVVAHGWTASVLLLVVLVQVVVAVLFWRPGGGPWWPAAASAALLVAETVQFGLGYARILALHVPIGVAVVAAAVALFWWSLRRRPAP